ncbi:MAG: hypothetical protein Kow00127_10310 [Bacteroidales bacterium]
MEHKIEILSPGPGCRRTRKVVDALSHFLEKQNVRYSLKVITSLDEILNYRTWLLPTVVINGKIVSRGYMPMEVTVLEHLNENGTEKNRE